MELKKITPVQLRSLGLDEKWLQDRLAEDPSLLGLGELDIVRKEKIQPTGGRIDFVMFNSDDNIRYVVEIMLGALDESHIIRTVEYWDIERQRYPSIDHRAVIVAEDITSRFFNVIRLLNRAVPIIALQLSAIQLDGGVGLHFVKVLDVYEETEIEGPAPEGTDRRYWEARSSPESLGVADCVIDIIAKAGFTPRVTYNKGHIAIGTTGYNFCWLHPRKEAPHCPTHIWIGPTDRDRVLARLREAGIAVAARGPEEIRARLTRIDCEQHLPLLSETLVAVEAEARH